MSPKEYEDMIHRIAFEKHTLVEACKEIVADYKFCKEHGDTYGNRAEVYVAELAAVLQDIGEGPKDRQREKRSWRYGQTMDYTPMSEEEARNRLEDKLKGAKK